MQSIYRITYLSFALAGALSITAKQQDPFIEVTAEDAFHKLIDKSEYAMVKFVSRTCPSCKVPLYTDSAPLPTAVEKDIKLVKVSINNVASLQKQFKVMGVPTFIFMEKGKEVNRIVGANVKKVRDTLADMAATVHAKPKLTKEVVEEHPVEKTTIKKPEAKPAHAAPVKAITSQAELQKHIDSNKPVIVKFHTEWCGFCKKIKGFFDKLAGDFEHKVTFVSVDADKAPEIAKKYGASGYPTFVSFHKGAKVDTVQGADKVALESHVKELASIKKKPDTTKVVKDRAKVVYDKGAAVAKKATEVVKKAARPDDHSGKVTNVKDTAQYEKYTTGDKPAIVKFSASWCGPCRQIAPTFEKFAKEYKDILFLSVDVDDARTLAQAEGVMSMPTFKVYWNNGTKSDTFTGGDKSKLESHIKKLNKKMA